MAIKRQKPKSPDKQKSIKMSEEESLNFYREVLKWVKSGSWWKEDEDEIK